ncbi:hypothetical protein HC028_07255 [Planosporangium flavigriseum]|uniref:Uncharacterized protein n=1 Tax=Planosporangium flavigriseum TaxID=373681 RepID=A0A8J3PLH9_9ACTN|nr:hypothetical protein [Planosporangium flavigriseum]NJC64309.1 hypothetical protein [Planosporangium flavigriseum]GIG73832.1 hypothetical protein Pfl04_22360 [Planosporangium flavigriseum]
MIRDGYAARWQGCEHEASPDGEQIRIYRASPEDGFEEVRPGRFRRFVPADEVEELVYIRTTCMWRDEPFIVLAEHESWLRVEYTGGLAPVAARLSLEEFDFGVYQGWVPRDEVTELREYRV